jgi:hypothetical protein
MNIEKKEKNRPFEYAKLHDKNERRRGIYNKWDICTSILNCGYRNDTIISD